MKRILSFLYSLFCRVFFKLYCPLKVYGRENLPDNSFILCSNHNSHMDTPVLMLATGLPFNRFGMVAAKDYFFDNKWRQFICNLMNLIPVDRKVSRTSLLKNISACQLFVKKGNRHLIIYPEGTRSITGEILPFKRGTAMMAKKLDMLLVPAYIEGTHEALRKGQFFPKMRRIKVRIGKPILVHSNYKQVTELMQKCIKELKELKFHETNEMVGMGRSQENI